MTKIGEYHQLGREKEKKRLCQLAKLVREITPRTQLVSCWKEVDAVCLVR